jgi:hypothetical protein
MIKIYSNFSLHYTVDSASLMRMALFYMYGEGNTSVRIERSEEDFCHFFLDRPSEIDEIVDAYFPPQKEENTVIISVFGGVADLVSKPPNIKVIIRDYDNETKESEFLEAVFDKS